MRVGVIQGYRYEGYLEKKFDNGELIRVDSPTNMDSISRLVAGEVDAIIHHEFETIHNLRQANLFSKVRFLEKPYQVYPIHCAISKRSSLSKERLDESIKQLKD